MNSEPIYEELTKYQAKLLRALSYGAAYISAIERLRQNDIDTIIEYGYAEIRSGMGGAQMWSITAKGRNYLRAEGASSNR